MNTKLPSKLARAGRDLQAAVDILETLGIDDLRALSDVMADLGQHCSRLPADGLADAEQSDGFLNAFTAARGGLAGHEVYDDEETGSAEQRAGGERSDADSAWKIVWGKRDKAWLAARCADCQAHLRGQQVPPMQAVGTVTSGTFDPCNHGFRKLSLAGPGGLQWFERHVDETDLDGWDPLRLNVYLTRDGGFTTIWYGLLAPSFAESKLGITVDLSLDLSEMYEQILFRGDIEEDAFGALLLQAIRIDRNVACELSMSDEFGLECHAIERTKGGGGS